MLRAFPELTAGLHLDRYARVLKVTDAPEEGGSSERFRPRYAVDIEILTPDGEKDEAYPVYQAVPLPVPVGAGMESGQYAFPEPGTHVVIGFAYGRADHPVIRQIYPTGLNLPELTNGEQRWQQSATVYQNADKHGNWKRTTEAIITDESLRQVTRCVERIDELSRELRTISENSTETIGGVKTLEALGAVHLGSGGRCNLYSVDSMNLTTARDLRCLVTDNKREGIGKDHQAEVKGNRISKIHKDETNTVGGNFTQKITGTSKEDIGGESTQYIGADALQDIGGDYTQHVDGDISIESGGNSSIESGGTISVESGGTATHSAGGVFTISAPKVKIGSGGGSGSGGGVSLLDEMLDVWKEVRDALAVLASHTHPVSGSTTNAPDQSGTIAGHGKEVAKHHDRVNSIKG